MPKIIIENLYHKEISSKGTDRKVIEIIHDNNVDWMHACGKKGRCTTCMMIVTAGMENLSEPTDRELYFRNLGKLKPHQRLTCQTQLKEGEIHIRVNDAYKLPHMDYGE
ncbi:2Fe-2S iron-sulfur cluster-binding protein [Echinicola vietnamensis]|uniref:Ferredoxin n=1 Tax=Echinicola vietnamensis (strain DSM 17526 / LMG 23754 / KMM 6221) TaxID=926556 RepID=L0FWP3_ECHVK|nr:2Fe-2S iron-sulfur cluster-binding protein [Echinicola vietnamensis]AGA77727.1 ferredoxin [Echinicola vietnamensis DSM 17526]